VKGRNSQKLITRLEKIEIGERQTSSSYWRMRTKSSQISFFSLLLFLSSFLSSDQVGERETTLKMSSWFFPFDPSLLLRRAFSELLSSNHNFFVLFTGKCCLDGARRVFFCNEENHMSCTFMRNEEKNIWKWMWERKWNKTKFNCRQFRCFIFFVLLINKNSSISFDVSSLLFCCCYIGPEESDITCWVLEEIKKKLNHWLIKIENWDDEMMKNREKAS